jgi:hypothetical protein
MTRSREYNREQRERVIKNRKRLIRDMKMSDGIKHDGEYAKRHPYDCGHKDCPLCHRHKVKGCESKDKDKHAILDLIIEKEVKDELKED